MPAVSNTSPLANLAVIGRLELLWEQFGAIWVPKAVSGELDRLGHRRGQESLLEARQRGLLHVQEIQNRTAAELLAGQLDRGEAEAIVLTEESKADWLLMDERDGRLQARRMGLQVTGVLGVLIKAKLGGRLERVRPELDRLRSEAHFFIGKDLENQVLSSVEEE
jgi:predicted nucleic acid-binding protein